MLRNCPLTPPRIAPATCVLHVQPKARNPPPTSPRSVATYSSPSDPWPLSPQDPNATHFQGYLWSEGFNIVISVQRISVYYVSISGRSRRAACAAQPGVLWARVAPAHATRARHEACSSLLTPPTHRRLVQIISSVFVIAINTYLALLVFSVSPRHLDTRLGIVVTLFLSLTALQARPLACAQELFAC